MSIQKVRVRFAPSPTGFLHIGGLRVAIFNWLFARHHEGDYVVRIEDTDRERSEEAYTQAILETLAWADISSDEPVVIQSQRIDVYNHYIEKLVQSGKAYRCYCSPQEVLERQRVAGESIEYIQYDRMCRNRTDVQDKSYVIRFAVPDTIEHITFHDIIRGPVTFDIHQLDDFVIARSDGYPMYNFVVVIDDHEMRISHVIRGEDHISNTPKQLLLYHALGFENPLFAHLPMILGKEGNRLSKRDAATDVRDYKRSGYLPDALVNYLVRLGWAHGNQEIFTRQEMIEYFSLQEVGKSGARFDQEKLNWLNSVYIKQKSSEYLVAYITAHLKPNFLEELKDFSIDQIYQLIELFKDRVVTVSELIDMIRLVYYGPESYHKDDIEAWLLVKHQHVIRDLAHYIKTLPNAEKETVIQAIKHYAQKHGLKLVDLAQPMRIALIGSTSGPGVFDLISILNIDTTFNRLDRLMQSI